ncbi:urease accessory protein UreD [Mycobacterium sp. SMC-4]|uniref:urease accessory protein UreD n=1 Tax=Mycobacterium sp. SMC-4 TaxID=2857059 RepID=UPI0021B48F49|nr:urease accessory protein UreD [Mycobacterium sp. SMC-4]UXA17373.1 urease accessory protein UreD [Mycobacterium sp. SMC-4]
MLTAPSVQPGELAVEVVVDARGNTRATTLRQRYPQRVTMPLRCDAQYPGAAVLCIQSPSGGSFSDDTLRTDVHCRPGSHLHLTTQSATQVFAGDGPGARQTLTLRVDAGAVLEYYPGTVIPHADSTFVQRVDVEVQPGGVYLGWEALAAGRIAHGERFAFTRYDAALVVRTDGRAVARDRQVIRPGHSPERLIGGNYLATFVAVAPGRCTESLLEKIRAIIAGLAGCIAGAGRLPAGAGVFVRLTAAHAPQLHDMRHQLFSQARTALVAVPSTSAQERR